MKTRPTDQEDAIPVVTKSVPADSWDATIDAYTQTMGPPDYSQYPPVAIFHREAKDYDVYLSLESQRPASGRESVVHNPNI